MFRNLSNKFANGTVMILKYREDNSVQFLGTGFLCHQDGYILTCAHLFTINEKLAVSIADSINHWNPISKVQVQANPVDIVQYNPINDVALLKLTGDFTVRIPNNLFGSADLSLVGSSVVYFGYPFGDTGLHVLKMSSSIISSKVITANGTKQLQLDSMVHNGTSGGPVFDVMMEKLIGIICGKQNPTGTTHSVIKIGNYALGQESSISYAVSIEYGLELMKQEGLNV